MSDIDLIPTHYRRLQQLRRVLRGAGLAFAVLLVALAVAKIGVVRQVGAERRRVEELRSAQAEQLDYAARLASLHAEKIDLDRRLEILHGLQQSVAAREVLLAVDRALDRDVWFSSWSFRRAGELVEAPAVEATPSYFIVIPASSTDQPERAWRVQTHMELRAQATDHSALARFVRRLVEQPEIDTVSVLRSELVRTTDSQLVQFELAVTLGGRG